MVVQIVVASGKGGTGKTTVSSSLLYLFNKDGYNPIAIDADVEAPDLVLAVGKSSIIKKDDIMESGVAEIHYEKCTYCMDCVDACQFRAIKNINNVPSVTRELCEGCGTCAIVCPTKAISLKRIKTGQIEVYKSDCGVIITGRLELGRRNSGLLVDIIREKMKEFLLDENKVVVIDAAPGIGCPVISSLTGANYSVIVAEPTRSSHNSAKRLLELIKHFNMPAGIIINKYNINEEFVSFIKNWAKENNLDFLGIIPYDKSVPEAYVNMYPVMEYAPNSSAAKAIKQIYTNLLEKLMKLNLIS